MTGRPVTIWGKGDFEFGQSLMTLDSIEPCVRLAPNTGGDQGEITGGNSM